MPSNTDRTTVYTIYAGMIPTLGFERGDFTVDREPVGGPESRIKGRSLDLGMSISPRGKQRKARVRGSVAWYEYSTTVRAIHEEVLDDDARTQGDTLQDGRQPATLRWPTDWKQMFESGNRGLADEFAREINPDILSPTGEVHRGVKGQPSEQETDLHGVTIEHPDDELEKQRGMLVNRARSVDEYVTGRDGNIYRLDVTSMSMDTGKAHHGLGTLSDRRQAHVDSASIMQDINAGNTADAEARLLTYFQGRTEEYNRVIRALKQHIHEASGGANLWLETLDLENSDEIEDIRRDLENNMQGQPTATPHTMQRLRPDLNTAIQRLERQGITGGSEYGTQQAFRSAVQFALHALGTIVQSRNTVTEYRITAAGAPIPYTIGVQHRMTPSGEQVLEFMTLRVEDVRIRNEAALENHYLRIELERQEVENIDLVLQRNAIDRNYQDSAYMIMQDNSSVEVGAITSAAYGDISRDANSLHLGGAAIMSDREFNNSIDEWIRTTGTKQGFKQKVHRFLNTHIHQGPMIEHAGRQQSNNVQQRNRYAQTAAPVGTDMTSLNTFNVIHHGGRRVWMHLPDVGLELTRDAAYMGLGTIPADAHIAERRSRYTIAGDLLTGALGGDAAGAMKLMGAAGKGQNEGMRLGGLQMASKSLRRQRWGQTAEGWTEDMDPIYKKTGSAKPGTLSGKTRKYWDLGEYLSDDQREGFDDNVNPYWWAAPYISLYYPAGQVGAK